MVKSKLITKPIKKPGSFTPIAARMVVPPGQTGGSTPVLWQNTITGEIINRNPGSSGGRDSIRKPILRNDNPMDVASITKPRQPLYPITNPKPIKPITKPRLPRLPITKPRLPINKPRPVTPVIIKQPPHLPINKPRLPRLPITKPLPITNPYKKAPTITNPIRPPTPLPIKPITKPTLPRKYIRPSAGPKIEPPWNVPKPSNSRIYPEGQTKGKWIYKNGEWVIRPSPPRRVYF